MSFQRFFPKMIILQNVDLQLTEISKYRQNAQPQLLSPIWKSLVIEINLST
jgi:hypothetical protein